MMVLLTALLSSF